MPASTNRTLWPVGGGAVAIQPGWFTGHATAFFYINLGDGTIPINMSLVMQPLFQITGPTKNPYPGTFCLPQVPLPANYTAKIGNNATIQVVEAAIHGAALYNVSWMHAFWMDGWMDEEMGGDFMLIVGGLQCVDITFADPTDVPEVNSSNCFNSSDIGFNLVFTTTSLSGADAVFSRPATWLASIPLAAALLWALLV